MSVSKLSSVPAMAPTPVPPPITGPRVAPVAFSSTFLELKARAERFVVDMSSFRNAPSLQGYLTLDRERASLVAGLQAEARRDPADRNLEFFQRAVESSGRALSSFERGSTERLGKRYRLSIESTPWPTRRSSTFCTLKERTAELARKMIRFHNDISVEEFAGLVKEVESLNSRLAIETSRDPSANPELELVRRVLAKTDRLLSDAREKVLSPDGQGEPRLTHSAWWNQPKARKPCLPFERWRTGQMVPLL